MCKSNNKSKMGKLASYDQGVSEVVGNILLFGIVVIAIGILTLTGIHIIDDARSSATLNSVEQAFTMVDSRLSKARFSTAIFQEAAFKVSGGLVTVNGSFDDSHIIITDYNNSSKESTTLYSESLGTIKCDTGNGIVAYQDGGVWLLQSGGSSMLSPPDFDYNGVTMTLPIMRINGNSSMVTNDGNINIIVNSTDFINKFPGKSGVNPLPQNHSINISIKSDYYQAWAEYFFERTDAEVIIDAKNKTVNASFITGTGLQQGNAIKGFSTKSMDTSYNAPILTFVFDLTKRNSGNDFVCRYGVDSDGYTYPSLKIEVEKVYGSTNDLYRELIIEYQYGSQIEIFSAYVDFERKSDNNELYINMLNRSIYLTYDGVSGSPQSFTWGDDPYSPDSSANPIMEFVEPYNHDVSDGQTKSLYDIVQHYMVYMAKYDQEHGESLDGPEYFIDKNSDFKCDDTSTFKLEFMASEDIKYLYITEGTLNTNLASGE